MTKRKKSKTFVGETCVYCGATADTSDHIPPQGVFAEPRSVALLEVPSCKVCNSSFSKDDEYFRTVLTMIEGVDQNPDAAKLLEAVHRSFNKPKKRGFTRSFIKTLRLVPRTTETGIYVGTSPSLEFDKTRILSTAERIIQGLYWIEKGIRLSPDRKVTAYWALDFLDNVKEPSQTLRNLGGYAFTKPSKVVGNEVFRYWVAFLEDDYPGQAETGQSVWLLRFYGTIDVLGVIT